MEDEVTLTMDMDTARVVLATLDSRAHQLRSYLADNTGVSSPQTAMARNKAFLLETAARDLNEAFDAVPMVVVYK
jgi:hypothetical protein